MMTSRELRKVFLDYFRSKGHTIVPSSSLIPDNDPTLLFTTAGMVQFKQYYSRVVEPPFPCAATVQKCLRAGGKGSDLENVGKTPRHHTFFEMLGNFSFGDYFKKEAIEYAYEFVTKVVKIPQEKLWVSVYQDDDEAFELWQKIGGFSADRIVRLGKKDNWWGPAGDEGACGPCSEIYIDLRGVIEYPPCEVEKPGPCDGFLEFWNLVFNQYNQDKEGKLHPLQYTGIDTGMGFERLLMILQGKKSVYETDIFEPIMKKAIKISGLKYEGKNRIPLNVIADHARAVTFVLAEGVFPSNEGRGYVLRHILRRAIRYGKMMGLDRPFFYQMVEPVVEAMGDAYPEIKEHAAMAEKVIHSEEEAFFKTLNRGLERLNDFIAEMKATGEGKLSGEKIFMLYDSLGFPLDFVQEIAADEGFALDMEGFQKRMEEQKQRARAHWKGEGFDLKLLQGTLQPTEYVGENLYECEAKVTKLIKNGQIVESVAENDDVILITDKTPFYGEKGGQVGDQGVLEHRATRVVIQDTKVYENTILHYGRVLNGTLQVGDVCLLRVDADKKQATARHHTATHLIHKALRSLLGDHVRQAGSYVSPVSLRFDFTHPQALTKEEIERIEEEVNRIILENRPVHRHIMSREEAMKSDAVAIFEEKYGDVVRVIEVEGYSKELCGGTHVHRTGDIGLVKIISESSVSAGTRRLEAVAGMRSLELLQTLFYRSKELALLLASEEEKILERVKDLQEQLREQEKTISENKKNLAWLEVERILATLAQDKPAMVITRLDVDQEAMLGVVDTFKTKVKSGVIFLFRVTQDEKVQMVCGVTKDLTSTIKANDLVKKVASQLGGGGGGRPDLAQAGGKDVAKIDEVIQSLSLELKSLLGV
ncbi:Alanyl-tRNA synthetase [Brevinematales bacterium NS]|nr:Alanyl-tRNA synthetase [Brevinematales bacterium NS]